MILSSIFTPSAITTTSPNDDLRHFVETYGFHGTLCSLARPGSPYTLSEVMQLDFGHRLHRPKNYKLIPNTYSEDEIQKHAIPTDDETLIRWTHAISSNKEVSIAHYENARYNFPIGLKRWVKMEEAEFERLSKLQILDYLY